MFKRNCLKWVLKILAFLLATAAMPWVSVYLIQIAHTTYSLLLLARHYFHHDVSSSPQVFSADLARDTVFMSSHRRRPSLYARTNLVRDVFGRAHNSDVRKDQLRMRRVLDSHPNASAYFVPRFKQKQKIPNVRRFLRKIPRPYYSRVRDEGFNIDRTYFSLRPTRISDVPEKFAITSKVCSPNPKSPTIVFIVPSVASSQDAEDRLEIRQTWASKLYGPTWTQGSFARLVFFFGGFGESSKVLQALKQESDKYGDIVVGDFQDSYSNLSLKIAVAITWAARNCQQITAAVKVDMDTYVNIEVLLSLMDQLPTITRPLYVFGHQHCDLNPFVFRTNKWAVPVSLYPFKIFPRYIYGHAYVLSGPAVKIMADSFPYFPIVPNEDAFVTGIMAVTLNITRYQHDSFAYLWERRTFCQMTQGVHVTDVIKPGNRLRLWNTFKTRLCFDEEL